MEQRRQRPPRAVLWGIGVGLVVLVLLGAGVLTGFGPQLRLDRAASVAFYVGDHRSLLVDRVLHLLTAPGYAWFRFLVFLPVVVWLIVRRAVWTTVWVLVAIGLISPITTGIKDLVGRVRPQFAHGGALDHSKSFPSGHASGIATMVVVALVLGWPFWSRTVRRVALVIGVLAIVVVGLSRMWLGVHYLSDVVAGWALGVAWTLAVAAAFGAFPGGRAALPARGGRPARERESA